MTAQVTYRHVPQAVTLSTVSHPPALVEVGTDLAFLNAVISLHSNYKLTVITTVIQDNGSVLLILSMFLSVCVFIVNSRHLQFSSFSVIIRCFPCPISYPLSVAIINLCHLPQSFSATLKSLSSGLAQQHRSLI